MTPTSSPTRTRLLALALATFGTVSACGGSEPAAESNTSSASSGGETQAASPGAPQGDVPTSTQAEPAAGTGTGSTECGHGACA